MEKYFTKLENLLKLVDKTPITFLEIECACCFGTWGRGTINPMIPNMAFVGYLESVANLHTAELRSIWVARLAEEKFKLPERQKMVEQINEEMEVMKRSTRFYKRHCISTYSINHSDQICEEMGWSPWRKNNWFSEAFSPYGTQDYNNKN